MGIFISFEGWPIVGDRLFASVAGVRCPVSGGGGRSAGGRCPLSVRCPHQPVRPLSMSVGPASGGRWPVAVAAGPVAGGGRCPVSGGVAGVGDRWPGVRCPCPGVRRPEAGGRWTTVAGGRHGGASALQQVYRNYDDDKDEDDYDFSNFEYCGFGACALVIEHEHYYGLGMDALVIGCSPT